MSASDLAAQYAADVDQRVQAALTAVHAGATRAKDDLADGVLNLRAESAPAELELQIPDIALHDDTAAYNFGNTADAFAGEGFDAPIGDAPIRDHNGAGALLDFETQTDEDGIPQWE